MTLKIVAVSGSLRIGSFNTTLMKYAAKLLTARGVEVDVFDFKAAQIPPYDADLHEPTSAPGVTDFKLRMKAAQGVLISSPEYNFSIPGVLKNLIDSASRPPAENPFRGKVAVQLGATPGMGGTLQAQMHLRHVLSFGMGCIVMPGQFTISKAQEAFDAAGQLKDEGQKKQLDGLLEKFVAELKLRNP